MAKRVPITIRCPNCGERFNSKKGHKCSIFKRLTTKVCPRCRKPIKFGTTHQCTGKN